MEDKKEILDNIESPADLKDLELSELVSLSAEIRNYLIETLSVIGGHFSSNLGVVELTLALHYVFDAPVDRIIWDVGHQTYVHKILTGRKKLLSTIRKSGGISGFPKREESPYDHYNTGHAGTSISQALGEAVSRDLTGKKNKVVAVIGDASIATGMALEAMNHAGHVAADMLVVLNDNYMSISKNVGSISAYLNNIISSGFYNKWKRFSYSFIKWLPIVGPAAERFFKKMEKSIKYAVTPGGLFEDLGFHYFGPVDGHDLMQLIPLIEKVKKIEGPKLIHVITQKGKGYQPAEKDPTSYHGVPAFDRVNGIPSGEKTNISYSEIVGRTLTSLGEENENVVVVTPAMIEGSGLSLFQSKFPHRLFDTGIAEQHAMAFSAAMTDNGLVPFLCIYSTFLSRAIDQLIEDVALMKLPVRLVIDRAGVVGPDGETHQGLFDMGLILSIPHIDMIAPSSAAQLIAALKFMANHNTGPIAVRFPKQNVPIEKADQSVPVLEYKKAHVLHTGNLLVLSVGSMLETSLSLKEKLALHGVTVGIIDLIWIRPLDIDAIEREIEKSDLFIILDESYLHSGASGYILQSISSKLLTKFLKSYSFPAEPIIHGEKNDIIKQFHLDAESIAFNLLENDLLKRITVSSEN